MEINFERLQRDKAVQAIKQRLVAGYSPIRMFLFGSRPRHSPTPQRLRPSNCRKRNQAVRWDNMVKARELHFDLDVTADVFVYSDNEFEEWKSELNSAAEVAHNLGVEIPLG